MSRHRLNKGTYSRWEGPKRLGKRVIYQPGDTLHNLTEDELVRLEGKITLLGESVSLAGIGSENDRVPSVVSSGLDIRAEEITNMQWKKAKGEISELNNESLLEKILELESASESPRPSIMKASRERLEELRDSTEEEDEEDSTEEEDEEA